MSKGKQSPLLLETHSVYGQLQEGLHITGYTFARACTHLEWLLEDNRWKQCTPGFEDVNKFLESLLDFKMFRASAEQRKRLANLIKKLQPQASNRQIARTLGVDEGTVRGDISAENSAPAPKNTSKNNGPKGTSAEFSALGPSGAEAARLVDQSYNKIVRGTQGTGENEWFTPELHIALARKVLGEIDLDPATHKQAQKVVRAATFYTKADDGLKHDWVGRVWLNPPYAQPLIAQFVSKMASERRAGRVTAAIMLTHNYSDTTWFHEALSIADAMCFTRGRVKFYEPDGTEAAPTQGQVFFYFGDDVVLFEREFTAVGSVAPCRFPRSR